MLVWFSSHQSESDDSAGPDNYSMHGAGMMASTRKAAREHV